LALSILSCGREPTAPDGSGNAGAVRWSRGLSWVAEFPPGFAQFQASGGVAFTKVRIVLKNPDGSVALDTLVNFPVGATELEVTLSVPLPAGAPASGQPMALTLAYQNAAGETVFTGGPVTVTVVPATPGSGPPPPSPVTIQLTYTGPGATATAVRIAPKVQTVQTGGGFTFTAQAVDATGAVLPNTPITFSSQNPALATVDAVTGVGKAGTQKGTVGIEARLLTGPVDVGTLTIQLPPPSLTLVTGSGQEGTPGAALGAAVIVQVATVDGVGVPGMAVTFTASQGGTATPASATTDANGAAQTRWTLGPVGGTQTLTVTSPGIAGSPIVVSAEARARAPVRLGWAAQPPATLVPGGTFSVAVNALDATGATVVTYTGPVSLALGTAPSGASLSGPTAVNAVGGVATFSGLKLTTTGSYTLVATAQPLEGTTSSRFEVLPADATKLVFLSYPANGAVTGTTLDPIRVQARDAVDNPVGTYTGAVTLTVNGPAAAVLGGDITASAAEPAHALVGPTTVLPQGGIATFTGLKLTTPGSYTFTATSGTLASATTPPFKVGAGVPVALLLASGGGQSITAGAILAAPVVVQVIDAAGNGVPGIPVTFTLATGGSVSPASATTDAGGLASTQWRLGSTQGPQTLTARTTALPGLSLAVTATARPPEPVALALLTAPPPQVVALQAFTLAVQAVDGNGAVAPSFNGPVTVRIKNGSATALLGTTTVSASAGQATFSDLKLSPMGQYTLEATATALTAVTTGAIDVTAAAQQLVLRSKAFTSVAAGALLGEFVVEVQDAQGNLATQFTSPVTLTPQGPSGATFAPGGVATVNAVGGVATFAGLALRTAGSYTLKATAGGDVPPTTGPAFTVTAGPATTLVLASGSAQSALGGAALSAPIVAKATDTYGNGISGITLTFTPVTGSVSPTTAVTTTSGTAQTTWTLGATLGTQTVNITASGLTPNPLAVTATAIASGITWTGATSSSWNVASNWSTGAVPTSADNVLIPGGTSNAPMLAATASVRNLTINGGSNGSIELSNYVLRAYGDVVAPLSVETVTCGDCSGSFHLVGGGGEHTVVGWFTSVVVDGAYRVSGTGNRLIVTGNLTMDGSGNLTVNGGRVDVGGLSTTSDATFTMANAADSVFVGNGGAAFGGGSTAGRLTAGTMTMTDGTLTSNSNYFAPSGTHTVVLAGTNDYVNFTGVSSYFQNVTVNAGTTFHLSSDVVVKGTLAHGAGTGTTTIASGSGNRTLTVSGLNLTSSINTVFTQVLLKFIDGTSNATFSNATFTGYTSTCGCVLFEVNRTGGPYTFGTLDFGSTGFVATSTTQHYVKNSGAADITVNTNNSGTSGTTYVTTGGTITWTPST
jgi:hypothetical protein